VSIGISMTWTSAPTDLGMAPPDHCAAVETLSPYPHVARCPECVDYAMDALSLFGAAAVTSATLSFHDSGHRGNSLTTATQHFGIDPAAGPW
jgi:hypothetical protein